MAVFPAYRLDSIADLTLIQFGALAELAERIAEEKAKALRP